MEKQTMDKRIKAYLVDGVCFTTELPRGEYTIDGGNTSIKVSSHQKITFPKNSVVERIIRTNTLVGYQLDTKEGLSEEISLKECDRVGESLGWYDEDGYLNYYSAEDEKQWKDYLSRLTPINVEDVEFVPVEYEAIPEAKPFNDFISPAKTLDWNVTNTLYIYSHKKHAVSLLVEGFSDRGIKVFESHRPEFMQVKLAGNEKFSYITSLSETPTELKRILKNSSKYYFTGTLESAVKEHDQTISLAEDFFYRLDQRDDELQYITVGKLRSKIAHISRVLDNVSCHKKSEITLQSARKLLYELDSVLLDN